MLSRPLLGPLERSDGPVDLMPLVALGVWLLLAFGLSRIVRAIRN